MKIAVFGGTGRTGREVIRMALQAGDEVTAMVRSTSTDSPSTSTRSWFEIDHPRLRVSAGNVTDADAVTEVVEHQDAVVSALGSTRKQPLAVCTEGVTNIMTAMARTGVRRVVVVSAFGAGESRDRSLYSRSVWLTIPAKMRDKNTMEQVIRASDLDWTIVRPPALGNGRPDGEYETSADLRMRITSWIRRADLADFIVRGLHSPTYVGATPGIRS